MAREQTLTAAGAVTWRRATRRPGDTGRRPVELLVVHRGRYDDWTFPKGKADDGEDVAAAAVREVEEETTERIRLGHPLPDTVYRVAKGTKRVHWWAARVDSRSETPFVPNDEVDEVRWVRPGQARKLLSYDHDLDLLESFLDLRDDKHHRTRTLVVVRHAKARARDEWSDDDEKRPLALAGERRAAALVPILRAYGVRRVVSSPAVRCTDTVDPFATSIGAFLRLDDRLSEDTTASAVRRCVDALVDGKTPAVVCGHRPTLPWVFAALGVEAPDLAPGEGVIVHHRRGTVLATEPLWRPTSRP